MTMQRRQHSGEFKAKVVLEALRGERTLNEMAAHYGVHPLQITQWKKVALEGLPKLLSSRRGTRQKEEEALKAALAATRTIPIVMVAIDFDPFALGYVTSLARPTGNVTGIVLEQIDLAGKRIQLVKEAFPHIGVFV